MGNPQLRAGGINEIQDMGNFDGMNIALPAHPSKSFFPPKKIVVFLDEFPCMKNAMDFEGFYNFVPTSEKLAQNIILVDTSFCV